MTQTEGEQKFSLHDKSVSLALTLHHDKILPKKSVALYSQTQARLGAYQSCQRVEDVEPDQTRTPIIYQPN